MIETYFGQNTLNTPQAFFAALLIGVAFGFTLERSGFGSSRRLAGVFYFKDMAVIKVMFSAMLTAMLGLELLMSLGWIPPGHLHFMETVYGAHAVGGLLFGVGFVMSGWCPGTAAVGVASGKWDALVFLVGTMIGAVAFSESFAWIKPLYNWGLQSEPQFAFGLPTHVFAFGFTVVGIGAFYFSEWMEKQVVGEGPFLHSRLLKGLSVAAIALAASLFIFPAEPVMTHTVARPVLNGTAAFGDTSLATIESGADHIEPETLAERLVLGDTNVLLVDVRPPVEFERFHIRGAVNVPLPELFSRLKPYRNTGEIVLYSNGMTHPAQAREQLVLHGYSNVYLLTDGLQGFLDRCLRPASLHTEPLPDDRAENIGTWRNYFLADTTCPLGSLEQLTTHELQPVACGSIAKFNTLGGIYLSSQPFPDDLRLAQQAGIKSVVNLRLPDELNWDESAVANSLGLNYTSVPFKAPEALTDDVFNKTRKILNDETQRPLLLHCHSANRVGAIWFAHRVLDGGISESEAEAEARSVGLKSADYLARARDYIARTQTK